MLQNNGIPEDFEVLYDSADIEKAVDRIAVRLNLDLEGRTVVFVCVMNGGLPFTWDLMRRVSLDLELDFVRVRRYHGTKGGALYTERDITSNIAGKDVVIVDDVLDKGVTLSSLYENFSAIAANVHTAVMVDKRALREVDIEADYVGFDAPDRFLVGRGMDLNGKYRHLPHICCKRD